MKLGISAGYEKAGIIRDAGFDYFEYNLVSLYSLSEEDMREAQETVERLGFYSEVMGIMLPTHMKVVGHHVDMDAVEKYLEVTLGRAERLGCRKIVFGSSHSRNMPKDFSDRAAAYNQIADFLNMSADMLEARGMTLVIEPCPVHENNMITFIPEAYYVMRKVNRPSVGIMADTYSMQFGYERMSEIAAYGDAIRHLHFSAPNHRIPHEKDGYDYSDFFSALHVMNYAGTLTIEAFHDGNFEKQVHEAFELLKNGLGKLY